MKADKVLDVFAYTDYKLLLRELIEKRSQLSKGIRSKFAESCGMNRTYLPQVLNSKAHLSEEQGLRAAQFLGMELLEIKYFQILLRIAKASTPDLQAFFEEERRELLVKNRELEKHLKKTNNLDEKISSTYYSQWFYSALHIGLYIPRFRNPRRAADYLGLSEATVLKVFKFLVSSGLAKEKKDGTFEAVESNFHLPKESPHVFKHHTNWRLKGLESLDRKQDHDFHYSSVAGLSRGDLKKIKALLIDSVARSRDCIAQSEPEEVLTALCVDFFILSNQEQY